MPLPVAVEIEDPYLWLEEVEGERALEAARGWTTATLERLRQDPRFEAFRAEALEVLTSDARLPTGAIRGDRFEGLWRDADHVRGVWRRARLDDLVAGEPTWEVLLDVDALDAREQRNWQWGGVTCAHRSDRCLVRLSRGGADAVVVRELSTTTGTFVPGGFELPEAKSDVTWLDEDTLLVATDRGPGTLTTSGYARTVVRWRRGTPLAQAEVVLEGQETDVFVGASVFHHGGQTTPVLTRAPTFHTQQAFLLAGDERVSLPLPPRSRVLGTFDGALLAKVNEPWRGWPSGSVVSLDLDDLEPSLVLAPEEGEALQQVAVGRSSLVVTSLRDVVGRARRLRPKRDGWRASVIDVPDHGVVSVSASSEGRDDVLLSFESLTVPSSLLHVSRQDEVRAIASLPAFFDPSDVVVEQRFATSADGTRVPYFLMGRRDVLAAGPAPTIQYGYGGFLASMTPAYFREDARPQHGALAGRLWVARGGVLVVSNLRGGGEYGPSWHQAALREHRHRAFEDFFAIGEHLVSTGVTTPAQLGALGRSNGGLLVGVAFTQRPDLYAAVDCGVPLLDMLRFHTLLAGASWMDEYGDPDVPEDRAVLASYSPYQRLADGVDYPALLLYTSTRDDRVHPGHARKFAARLEALGVPFEYFENEEGGHGGVANQEQGALRIALEYTLFARALGLQ